MKIRRINLLLKAIFVWIIVTSQFQFVYIARDEKENGTQNAQEALRGKSSLSEKGNPVFEDYFNTSMGYNDTFWSLESYGNGSISWIGGELFNMSSKKHSYRTLSSKQTFVVGHEISIRMRMREEETIVCVGWTNTTADIWNYLFAGDSVYIEAALSTLLFTQKRDDRSDKIVKHLPDVDMSEYHDYRIVWNSSVMISYIDGVRVGAIGGEMPEGPLHFKIAITENRDVETEGWVCLDSVRILEHHSLISESPPFITLNSPGNRTLNLGSDPIDVVPIGSNGTLFWSWDGTSNKTSTAPYDIKLPSEEGVHILNIYCKDGYGYGSWDHARYVFETMVTPPIIDAAWLMPSPFIDGVIQSGEWPAKSTQEYDLVRADSVATAVNVSIGCDNRFLYIAIDSPVPSGHDSRAAVILTGHPDGHYHGLNETPITSAYYTMGSPAAWEGYTELKFLGETPEHTIIEQKVEPIPQGFLAKSSERGTHVHYEFRFPLGELETAPGSTVGISLMLFPTGMGVHNSFYPIAYPWSNASRLAIVTLPLPPSAEPVRQQDN